MEGGQGERETVPGRASHTSKSPEGRKSRPVGGPEGGWYGRGVRSKRRERNGLKPERRQGPDQSAPLSIVRRLQMAVREQMAEAERSAGRPGRKGDSSGLDYSDDGEKLMN